MYLVIFLKILSLKTIGLPCMDTKIKRISSYSGP